MLAKEKITRYVIENNKNGYSFEKIKETLIKINFSPELIDQVIHEVKINNVINIIEDKKKIGYKKEAIEKLLETFGYSSEDIKKAMAHSDLNENAKQTNTNSDKQEDDSKPDGSKDEGVKSSSLEEELNIDEEPINSEKKSRTKSSNENAKKENSIEKDSSKENSYGSDFGLPDNSGGEKDLYDNSKESTSNESESHKKKESKTKSPNENAKNENSVEKDSSKENSYGSDFGLPDNSGDEKDLYDNSKESTSNESESHKKKESKTKSSKGNVKKENPILNLSVLSESSKPDANTSSQEEPESDIVSKSSGTKLSLLDYPFFDSIKSYTKKALNSIKDFSKSLDFSRLNKHNDYYYIIIGFVFITLIFSAVFIFIDIENNTGDEPEVRGEPNIPDFSLVIRNKEIKAGSSINYSLLFEELPEGDDPFIVELSIVSIDTGDILLSKRDTKNILSLEKEEFSFLIGNDTPPGNYTLKKEIFDTVERREFEKNLTIKKTDDKSVEVGDDGDEVCEEECSDEEVCFEGSCCEPETCITLGFECGKADDSCGNELDCGDCLRGEVCEEGICVGLTGSCKNNETVTWSNDSGKGDDCGPVDFDGRYTADGDTQDVTYSNNFRGEATFECIEGSWKFVKGSCIEIDYNLLLNVEGEGSTNPESGLNWYFEGETVEITAEAADGWEFVRFSGDCSGSSCSLEMDEDKEVSVIFSEKPEECNLEYTVSWGDGTDISSNCGPVSLGEGMVSHGQQETISFSNDEYEGSATYECSNGTWEFVEGTCDMDCNSQDYKSCHHGDVYWYDSCGNREDLAEECNHGCEDAGCLEEEVEYTISIDITGQGTTNPNEGTNTYEEGEVVEIIATPEDGWEFLEWAGDCSGSGDCEVTMDGNKEITAFFAEDENGSENANGDCDYCCNEDYSTSLREVEYNGDTLEFISLDDLSYSKLEHEFSKSGNSAFEDVTNLDCIQLFFLFDLPVEDTSFLSELPEIEAIRFDNTSVSDLSPLSDLENIEIIHLSNSNVEDVSPLEEVGSLVALNLEGNPISTIDSLKNLDNLNFLSIKDTGISGQDCETLGEELDGTHINC